MQNRIKSIGAALLSLVAVAAIASAHGDVFKPEYVDSLIPSYLQLQTALAGDDLVAAQFAAKSLRATAIKGTDFKEFARFTHEIITAVNLKIARVNFADVSSELMTLIEHVGTTGKQALYAAHCPMAFDGKGGDWLQADENVLNPYYGAMMLRCGSINQQVSGEWQDGHKSNPNAGRRMVPGNDQQSVARQPDGTHFNPKAVAALEAAHKNVPEYFSMTTTPNASASSETAGASSCGMACCAGSN